MGSKHMQCLLARHCREKMRQNTIPSIWKLGTQLGGKKTPKQQLIHPKKDNKQYQVANEMKTLNPQFPPSIKFLQVFQLFLHYLLLHFLLCQVSHSKLPCGEEMLLSLTSLCSITPSHPPAHNLTSLTHLSSPTKHSSPLAYTSAYKFTSSFFHVDRTFLPNMQTQNEEAMSLCKQKELWEVCQSKSFYLFSYFF